MIAAEQLLLLRAEGAGAPIFFVHPSGGEITAYLRLALLLDADRPSYGVRSRALSDTTEELGSVAEMAASYAALIAERIEGAACALAGWSLGALVAHAVAGELERAGNTVELVALLDPTTPRTIVARDRMRIAVAGALYETNPRHAPSFARLQQQLAAADIGSPDSAAHWAEHNALLPRAVAPAHFAQLVRLRELHIAMGCEHEPQPIAAPLEIWRGNSPIGHYAWADVTRAAAREYQIDGDHFSIIRPPHVDAVARQLSKALRGARRG